jgi:hypothetical protein
VSAGWVAAGVRSSAMARRRLGHDDIRRVAGGTSLPEALDVLAGTPYKLYVHQGQTLAEADREVTETVLWHLRVLAAGCPPRGCRCCACWPDGSRSPTSMNG